MARERIRARLFVDEDLAPGAAVKLAGSPAHYLTHVMRCREGESVLLFNGRNGEWRARIDVVAKSGCMLVPERRTRNQTPESDLWLAFAPLKKTPTDFVVEKATELGVARFLPVITRHTATARVNTARLRARAVEAAEQCGRLTVPEVAEAISLAALSGGWPPDRTLLVLDETGAGRPLAEAFMSLRGAACDPSPAHGILIGPEGGFSASELDGLVKLPFVNRIGAGPRILRAETAAVAALACWQALLGDWRDSRPPEPDPGEP